MLWKYRWFGVVVLFAFLSGLSLLQAQDGVAAAESSLWEEIQALYEAAKEKGEQVPKDVYAWVQADLQTIGDWEYQVFDMEVSDAAMIEGKLNELGADRWECIWIQPGGAKTRIFLKRSSRSYLRHIPLSQLMKLVPGGDPAS